VTTQLWHFSAPRTPQVSRHLKLWAQLFNKRSRSVGFYRARQSAGGVSIEPMYSSTTHTALFPAFKVEKLILMKKMFCWKSNEKLKTLSSHVLSMYSTGGFHAKIWAFRRKAVRLSPFVQFHAIWKGIMECESGFYEILHAPFPFRSAYFCDFKQSAACTAADCIEQLSIFNAGKHTTGWY
jgi:hypothetical protein